jgi:hypothetical protein
LIDESSAALPDPQLHGGFGQRKLELLVFYSQAPLLGTTCCAGSAAGHLLEPLTACFEKLMLPFGHLSR